MNLRYLNKALSLYAQEKINAAMLTDNQSSE